MWFHKKSNKLAPQPMMPAAPTFPDIPRESESPLQPYERVAPQIPPLRPLISPSEYLEDIQEHQSPLPEIPRREPAFFKKEQQPIIIQQPPAASQAPYNIQPFPRPKETLQPQIFQAAKIQMPQFAPLQEQTPDAFRKPLTQQREEEARIITPQQQAQDPKPIFVKLERYREVLSNLEVLKEKIKETEYLLDKIEELRAQEKVELENCHGTLNKLKEKLISIDKKLFDA